MPAPPLPLVLVTWEDSAQAVPGWQWLAEMAPPRVVTCYTAPRRTHPHKQQKARQP